MENPTLSQRVAALVAAINAEDVRQGRPDDVAPRTADADDLNVRLSPDHVGGRVLLADIDNHVFNQPFAVVTLDESGTAKEFTLDHDLGEEDCVEVNGVTFVVVAID